MSSRKRLMLIIGASVGILLGILSGVFLGGLHLSLRQIEQCGKQESEWIEMCEKRWYGFYAPRFGDNNVASNPQATPTSTPIPEPTLSFLPTISGTSEPDNSKFPEMFDDYNEWGLFTSGGGEFTMQVPTGIKLSDHSLPRHIAALALTDTETGEHMLITIYKSAGTKSIVGEAISDYAYGLPDRYGEACGIASVKPGRTAFRVDGNSGLYIIQKGSSESECVLQRTGRAFALVANEKYLVEVAAPEIQLANPEAKGGALDIGSLQLRAALQTLTFND